MKNSKPYVAGGKTLPDKVNGQEIAKLNANENQLGPSPKALQAIRDSLTDEYLYPAPQVSITKEKIADWLGFKKENINITCGSIALINAIADSFLNPDEEVLISSPSYPIYYSLPQRYGAKLVEVKNKNYASDIYALLDAINDKTKLVIIVNPNNPTGGLVSAKDMEYYMEHVPEHVITIVDEAYIEWVNKPYYTDCLKYVASKNIIILRTFSKIFGMAGLRFGYSISQKEIAERINIVEGNYSVSRAALIGARSAIDDIEFQERSIKNNTEGREYLMKEMRELGFEVAESYTSFVYFNCHRDVDEVLQHLESRGIFIRPFDPYLRISVGRPEQNQRFIEALKEIF